MKNQPYNIFLKNSYSFKYSFSMEFLKKDWLLASGTNIYLQPNYLNAIENSVVSDVTFIYVVVYLKEVPVGVVYFQWIQIGKDFFSQEKFPSEINFRSTSVVLKRIKGSLLLCGNFFATGVNGFSFSEKVPSVVLDQLIKKLKYSLCRSKNTKSLRFIMFKEFWKESDVLVQKQLLKTTAGFQIDVNMILEIHSKWNNLEDYLNAMTTKYRTRAKSVFKKTSEITSREFDLSEIKEYELEIDKLYNSVLNTSSFNMVKLGKGSFYQLKKELNEVFFFTGYFYKNKLIAFSTACLNNACLDANYVGINYDYNDQFPVYQRILYDYVDLAIAKNTQELRLGRTAETMKSSLGAMPKEMNLYIKHTNILLHTILKPLVAYVKPSSYQIRKPFKKEFLENVN